MPARLLVVPFVVLAFLAWGVYGPALHLGQGAMPHSSLRPFWCVGVAYFVVAVVAPLLVLRSRGEQGQWTLAGVLWSVAAGAVGAVGALGILLAFKFGGRPMYVMPLVFGGAPVVHTVATMALARSFRGAAATFYAGVILVALGVAGVLLFKPGGAHIRMQDLSLSVGQFVLEMISIGASALCWGIYGPLLHKGQARMRGSGLRPFLCVGLTYFVIAVLLPPLLLTFSAAEGGWTFAGAAWSLAGGAAGAVGALGIILAFNAGGKPVYVMPLVFGGAPVVNTLLSAAMPSTAGQVSPLFYVSVALVIGGAVTTLVFAPRPGAAAEAEEAPMGQTPAGAQDGGPAGAW